MATNMALFVLIDDLPYEEWELERAQDLEEFCTAFKAACRKAVAIEHTFDLAWTFPLMMETLHRVAVTPLRYEGGNPFGSDVGIVVPREDGIVRLFFASRPGFWDEIGRADGLANALAAMRTTAEEDDAAILRYASFNAEQDRKAREAEFAAIDASLEGENEGEKE